MKSLYNRITNRLGALVCERHAWLAAGLIIVMAALGLGSMAGNSATMDEVPHIAAGYSYDRYADYRLNSEHPPLIKNLAGLPLLFMDLKFPEHRPAWTDDPNGQWEAGRDFLYHLGNDADKILFWARLPLLVLALGFGVFLYWFCRRRWGTAVALLALFFYTLSPNFLAHSTVVTTDVGASACMFLAIVAFARFVQNPTRSNLVLLSAGLAVAVLVKFSAFLLYPFLGAITVGLALAAPKAQTLARRLWTYTGGFVAASALSTLWVLVYYGPQVMRMPQWVQDRVITTAFSVDSARFMAEILMNLNNLPFMKALTQYLLGLCMVFGRVAGGNVTYLNGEVSKTGFHAYFPIAFLLKTPLPFLILLAVALGWGFWKAYTYRKQGRSHGLLGAMRAHVLEWTLGLFAIFYFSVSVAGNLNLGIRHILPMYVPLFVLVALATVKIWRKLSARGHTKPAGVVLAALLLWYGGGTLLTYPSFLPYLNELGGGPANAHKHFTDSNVDWGQDLRRLKTYVKDHPEIKRLGLNYFGGGEPAYYFCERRYDARGNLIDTATGYDCSNSVYEPWNAWQGKYPGEYIAISETHLQNDRYFAPLNNWPGYGYLREREPIAKIGNSIYVYHLPENRR